MKDHYLDAERSRAPLPVSVAEILTRVPDVDLEDGPRTLTTGAVAKAFGSKIDLLEAVAAALIDPENVIGALGEQVAQLRRQGIKAQVTREALASMDLKNMAISLALTRHWFAAHSQAANPHIAEQVRRVYQGFDELLAPLYAEIGRIEGRRPVDGMTWRHVANAFTAWTEGLALRYHYGHDGERETPWQDLQELMPLMVRGADSLWRGLTCYVEME
jgi:AcrR family transcriptional regulator